MEIKEAIEVIKKNWPDSSFTMLREALETLIPELKESEDERIRKGLIDTFSIYYKDKPDAEWGGIPVKDILAWLEKQGEQKYIPKYKIGDYVKNTNYKGEPIYEIVYMDKECYICEYRGKERMGDKAVMHFSFDNPYLRLVQKPADKIEPKFEIGDLITNGILVGKIDEIHELGYHAYFGDHYADVPDVENWHKWTIQDAKDGDVLVCESGWTCIFKKLNHNSFGEILFDSYCFIDRTGWFCDGAKGHTLNERINGKIYPATKEQSDLLFAKMKEAGYEWDAEKKELKKIEQEPTTWSEKDKAHIDSLLKRLEGMCKPDATFISTEFAISEDEDWLESLRHRLQWKPSDEQMEYLAKAITTLGNEGDNKTSSILYELRTNLKKLKG